MKRTILGAAVTTILIGCGSHQTNFTLPPLAGGNSNLSFQFEERPQPVLTDSVDALNPSVVKSHPSGQFSVFDNIYSVFNGNSWVTGFATSDDGIRWESKGEVLSPGPQAWEGGYIAANGSALEYRGGFWYWYQAGPRNRSSIGFAKMDVNQTISDSGSSISDGGIWFQKKATAVMAPGPFESWDERAVADPNVIRIDPYFYMYYLGQDRAQPPRQRIGVARSRDGIHWEKLAANPVLSPGFPGSFDEAGVGEPAVWSYGGYYWMLFTGRNFSEQRGLGLARSTDGVHWSKQPGYFRGASAWDSKVICDPAVLVDGSTIKVWFGGGDVASPDERLHGKIGYATLIPRNAAEPK